jgi:hypothetical protein
VHYTGVFLVFFSSSAPQFQLCQWMLGLNPGLFLLSHWQSDALTTQLDLINFYYRYQKNEQYQVLIFCTFSIRFYHFNSSNLQTNLRRLNKSISTAIWMDTVNLVDNAAKCFIHNSFNNPPPLSRNSYLRAGWWDDHDQPTQAWSTESLEKSS